MAVGGLMVRFVGYATGTVAFAVGSAFLIFVIWNLLIRAEIIANATMEWYPAIAIVWGCLCLGGGALLYRLRQGGREG